MQYNHVHMQTTAKRRYYREFHDLTDYGFPEVPLFGAYRFDKAVEPLHIHTHSDLEVCYLVEGRQNYRALGRDYLLKGGDLFLTKPNEPHSTGKQPQEKGSLFWFHLMAPKKNSPFLGLHHLFSKDLYARLSMIKDNCFPASSMVRDLFEDLYVQLSMPDAPSRKISMGNILVSLIIEISRCGEKPQRIEDRNLNKIIQFMNAGELAFEGLRRLDERVFCRQGQLPGILRRLPLLGYGNRLRRLLSPWRRYGIPEEACRRKE